MGDLALTKRICGFDSRLLLGPVIPKTFKNGSGLFLHGTHDEGGTMKHNWSARCQYNVTGWVFSFKNNIEHQFRCILRMHSYLCITAVSDLDTK